MRTDIRGTYEREAAGPDGALQINTEYSAVINTSEYEKILLPSLVSLRENFRTGKYSLVVGEDSSARICTLIIARLAKKITEESGVKSPETRFIRGFVDFEKNNTDLIKQQLEKWLSGNDQRNILYVSESIGQAGSLANFVAASAEVQANIDVLIAENWSSISNFRQRLEELVGKEKVDMTLGTLSVGPYVNDITETPVIFHRPELSGVISNSNEVDKNVFASPYMGNEPDIISATRRTANQVADNLYLELAPSLVELFESIDIPFDKLIEMSKEDRIKLRDWISIIKIRVSQDPKIKLTSEKNGIQIDQSLFEDLEIYVLTAGDVESAKIPQEYKRINRYPQVLARIKESLIELEKFSLSN